MRKQTRLSEAGLRRRLQREFARRGLELRKDYGGGYYIVDRKAGTITDINLQQYAREIGVLKRGESLAK
jgi:hypothetical protein